MEPAQSVQSVQSVQMAEGWLRQAEQISAFQKFCNNVSMSAMTGCVAAFEIVSNGGCGPFGDQMDYGMIARPVT